MCLTYIAKYTRPLQVWLCCGILDCPVFVCFLHIVQMLSHVRLFGIPMDCIPPLYPWGSLGKNPGVGCYFLLQGLLAEIADGKASVYDVGDSGSIPGLGRFLGEGNGNPLQYYCLEKSHGQRSLVGYSPWGHKEWDTIERLHFTSLQHFLVWEMYGMLMLI